MDDHELFYHSQHQFLLYGSRLLRLLMFGIISWRMNLEVWTFEGIVLDLKWFFPCKKINGVEIVFWMPSVEYWIQLLKQEWQRDHVPLKYLAVGPWQRRHDPWGPQESPSLPAANGTVRNNIVQLWSMPECSLLPLAWALSPAIKLLYLLDLQSSPSLILRHQHRNLD